MNFRRFDTQGCLARRLQKLGPLEEADTMALSLIEADGQLIQGGVNLIQQGDRPEGMLAITEGFACRYKVRTNGARQILAFLVPGDVFDPATSAVGRMDYSIGTLSACRVVRLSPEAATELRQRPAVAKALQNASLLQAIVLREWMLSLGRRSTIERLSHLFCELLLRQNAAASCMGFTCDLPVTQTDLADATGVTAIHVNRSLKELKRMKLIDLKHRYLTIRDLPRLMEVAEFRPDYLHISEQAGT